MKVLYKVMSVILILWALYSGYESVRVLVLSDEIMDEAKNYGSGTGAVAGAVGTYGTLIGLIALVVACFMLYAAICGLRGLTNKSRKVTKVFAIITGIELVLSLIDGSDIAFTLIELVFFGLYYYAAGKCNESSDSFY